MEAATLGRIPMGCDIGPLRNILIRPRLNPSPIKDVEEPLRAIDLDQKNQILEDRQLF